MRKIALILVTIMMPYVFYAQKENKSEEQKILLLSKKIWNATLQGDFQTLENQIDEKAYFVHMGATLSKEQELDAFKNKLITPNVRFE